MKNLEDLESEDTKGDMKELAKEERNKYETSLKLTDDKILESLFPKEFSYGMSECIFEINASVGGQEAMLFTKELLEMYQRYAESRGWSTQLLNIDVADGGGVRHASMIVSGKGVLEILNLEAGVHRVQRVPETEKSGRLHTSTVSVAVLIQPSEIEIQLPDCELRIETKRSSGAGGQHVNTTDSCVRVTHIPTGLSVECQSEREQFKNKKNALARLRALLFQKKQNEQDQKVKETRKSQIGSGFRNEKIRTYNFNQDRVTDHRIGGSGGTVHDLKGFLAGGPPLNSMIILLQHFDHRQSVLEIIESFRKENKSS
ncbi:mitochondrial translation release factor 1 isoform X2 [Arctopsyche grandis]